MSAVRSPLTHMYIKQTYRGPTNQSCFLVERYKTANWFLPSVNRASPSNNY